MEVDNNKIIHLYMLDECKHKCKFCCNKQYDCSAIPVVTVDELKYADTVCLTGGEPFLLDNVCDFAEKIKTQYPNIKTIYVYSCGDSLYDWLNKNGRLHHAVFGLASEAGEVSGIMQKVFQGHEFDKEHMKKELGDCLWMIAEACEALDFDMDDVMQLNIDKLKARYPQGFTAENSLHRKEGDI